jgi:hypothetical protein
MACPSDITVENLSGQYLLVNRRSFIPNRQLDAIIQIANLFSVFLGWQSKSLSDPVEPIFEIVRLI